MFQLSTRQIAIFRRTALSVFEEEMVDHCTALAPRVAATLGRQKLGEVVQAAIARAAGRSFTLQGPVRLFVELGFLFGSSFDTDVQYPWSQDDLCRSEEASPLDPTNEQMDRAARLHHASIDALAEIRGPNDCHIHVALPRVLDLAAEASLDLDDDLPALALAAFEHVHPTKYDFVGEPALRELIASGVSEAARYGLDAPRDVLLLIGLMFAFGQG